MVPSRLLAAAGGLLVSSIALALAIALIVGRHGHAISIDDLEGPEALEGWLVFGLLVLAVIFRKGICPHTPGWPMRRRVARQFPTALLLNGHFGALLVAKLIVPLFPPTDGNSFPVLSYLAMATALYVAIRALTREFAASAAGLSRAEPVRLHSGWTGEPDCRRNHRRAGPLVRGHGLDRGPLWDSAAARGPLRGESDGEPASRPGRARAAAGGLVCGIRTRAGWLPGTLSFCSQDLLIHGTLLSHPLTGLLLPIATAMNAVSVFRLFTRLFLGKSRTGFTVMADALPRERWILAAGILFVVLGGLFPYAIVAQRSEETDMAHQAIDTTRSSVEVYRRRSPSTLRSNAAGNDVAPAQRGGNVATPPR